MAINVFISVGRPINDVQEAFLASIEEHLRANDLRPRTVGRNVFTHKSPLHFVDELMNHCAGTIVVALERLSVERAVDKRGSTQEKVVEGIAIPTPWNQIEAAFSYSKGLPLLVIKDQRIPGDGLLEKGYDWYVHDTAVDPAFLSSREFHGTFDSWLTNVKKRAGWFGCRKE